MTKPLPITLKAALDRLATLRGLPSVDEILARDRPPARQVQILKFPWWAK